MIVRLRTVFRWAAAERMVPPAVPAALAMVRGLRPGEECVREGAPVRPEARKVAEATAAAAPPTFAVMIRLQLATGMRSGALVGMRPQDIDRSGPVWLYRPASHKNEWRGQPRIVPIVKAAPAILAPLLLRPDNAFCFSPREAMAWRQAQRAEARRTPDSCGNRPGTNRKVFPLHPPGEKYTPMTYANAVRAACRKAFPRPADMSPAEFGEWRKEKPDEVAAWEQVHRWHPHRVRHLVATELRSRLGIDAARAALGHASIHATALYAERDVTAAADALRAIAG